MATLKFAHWFVAIRKRTDSGDEWADISTLTVIGTAHAMSLSREVDAQAGRSWADANPVVRLVRLECAEIADSALPPFGKR